MSGNEFQLPQEPSISRSVRNNSHVSLDETDRDQGTMRMLLLLFVNSGLTLILRAKNEFIICMHPKYYIFNRPVPR